MADIMRRLILLSPILPLAGPLNPIRGVGLGPLPPFALNARTQDVGDSITDQSQSTSDGNLFYTNVGWTTWANALNLGKTYQPPGGNLAINAETAQSFAATRLSEIAVGTVLVRIFLGTNDIGLNDRTAKEVIADLSAIRDRAFEVGARVTFVQIAPRWDGGSYPRFEGEPAWTPAKETKRLLVNLWMGAQAKTDNRICSADTSSLLEIDTRDGLHPLAIGAKKIGQGVSTAEAPWMPPESIVGAFMGAGQLIANPHWNGTSGYAVPGAPIHTTGHLADFTDSWYDGGGADLALSKSAEDHQVFTFSGSYTGNDKTEYAGNPSGPVASIIANGDLVEGLLEFKVLATPRNIAGISLVSLFKDTGESIMQESSYSYLPVANLDPGPMPLVAGEHYVFRTPQRAAPSGVNRSYASVHIFQCNTGGTLPLSGAIEVVTTATREVV
jgi:hypothetical protein